MGKAFARAVMPLGAVSLSPGGRPSIHRVTDKACSRISPIAPVLEVYPLPSGAQLFLFASDE